MSQKNQSYIEDLMEVAAYLPWWADIVLAVAGYFIFHQLALIDTGASRVVGDTFNLHMVKSLSNVLQYVTPFIFSVCAVISAYWRWQCKRLYHSHNTIQSIRALRWDKFEQRIGEAYRQKGYYVIDAPEGRDADVDLILVKDGKRRFVQCKHWKKQKVGLREVEELYSMVTARHIYSGIMITTGIYTIEALAFADNGPLELIDGNDLITLIPDRDGQALK